MIITYDVVYRYNDQGYQHKVDKDKSLYRLLRVKVTLLSVYPRNHTTLCMMERLDASIVIDYVYKVFYKHNHD